MNQNVESYKKATILSASPERLILMLYDGALDAMRRAKSGFKLEEVKSRNETISNNLIKAQNIFGELQRSLRPEKGKEFADRMFGLYAFYSMKLNEANFKKEEAPIDLAIELSSEIRDAWEEMLAKQKVKAESVPVTSGMGVGEGLSLRA